MNQSDSCYLNVLITALKAEWRRRLPGARHATISLGRRDVDAALTSKAVLQLQ